jgi:hypothetical protein
VKQAAINTFIEAALQTGMIEATPTATSWSQILLTPKPNGKWRFCLDYRALNELTTSMGWPIPNIYQMADTKLVLLLKNQNTLACLT